MLYLYSLHPRLTYFYVLSVLSLALAGAPAGAEDLDEEGANVGSPHKTAADVPAPAPSSSLSDSAVPEESPWLVTPSFSVDPKLGTTAGGIIAYMPRFDEQSTPSIIGVAASYSNTDSVVGGVFADTYWNGDRHRLLAGVAFGTIRNEYDDFLGTGESIRTVDNLKAGALRYRTRVSDHLYLGGQLVHTNYTIDFPSSNISGPIIDQVGVIGFQAAGFGLVAEYDQRNDIRNPTQGSYALLHNIAYRAVLGGQDSFDVYALDARRYIDLGRWISSGATPHSVLALELSNRWTADAPLAGYSSVTMPGYTRGNYLGENYSHVQFDLRVPVAARWGVVAFGGVGCLYGAEKSCTENLYPSVGVGLTYLIKPQAGVIVRAEAAKGDGDNSAFYLRFGHPF